MLCRTLLRAIALGGAAAALIALVACGSASTPAASPRPDLQHQLDSLFGDLHRRGLFDGAAVVGRREQILWTRGYGLANEGAQTPFTPDTPADGASIMKTFTTALLVALHRERKLDLDAAAQRWLPELPYPEITLRHLITHSSGLHVAEYDYFDAHLPAGEVRTTARLLAVIAANKPPLETPPGTAFRYSSLGFDLATLAAERATGMQLRDLLAERFFRPLGITTAFLRPGRFVEFPGTRTVGYRRVAGKRVPNEVFDGEAFHGGSNLYLSARDLHRWNASWIAAPDAELHEPARIGGAPSGVTLGSWYRAHGAFWYPGHLQGFHDVVFREGDTSIVYVSNNTLEPWLHNEIIRAVRRIVAGEVVGALERPRLDALPRDAYPAIAGRWVLPDGERYEIDVEPDLAIRRDGVRYRAVRFDDELHYVPGLDYLIGRRADKMYVSTNVEERWAIRR